MESSNVAELKQFIDQCKSDPSILHHPSLGFFRTFIQSLGARIPSASESRYNQAPQQTVTPNSQILEPSTHVPCFQPFEESPYEGSNSHFDDCDAEEEVIPETQAPPIMSHPLPDNRNRQPTQISPVGARKWSIREDEALIACYMEHCTDAIKTNQKASELWRKAWLSYKVVQANSPQELGVRTLKMLENRWRRMVTEVNAWIPCYDEARKLAGSGYGDEGATTIAHKLYQTASKGNKNFSCVHAWQMLNKYPNWRLKMRWGMSKKEREVVDLGVDVEVEVEVSSANKRVRADGDSDAVIGSSSYTSGGVCHPNDAKKAKPKVKGNQVTGGQVVECTIALNESTSLKREKFEFEKEKFKQKQRQLELDEMKANNERRKANFDMLQILMAKPSPLPCEVKEINRLCKELYGDD